MTTNGTSTAQQIASVIKSARDIMRKDKGLNGDLDRLPMLTWMMFLKFLDDSEQVGETEATLRGEHFVSAIEPPYRWRDWAGDAKGITGDELIAFINQDEAVRPDGERGLGLFAHLRSLGGAEGGDRRDVIATVFRGTINRMINGYLLRDVVNKIDDIHFTSSDEVHTLGLLYESMLKDMRDAAGDSGEFYTPRPVVEFITRVVDPRLGETILDPAAGTGGFLAAAFDHLERQTRTVADRDTLQRKSLLGIEAKPLPYLLCQMNLVLHGLEYPSIDPGNALRFPLREIGDRDRVDVVVTNPPFGGEEETGILSNFPDDKRTSETALLFLQLIMRKLRRPKGASKGGRCGMVVSDGFLSTRGVAGRIKEELLSDFNLHTIVRLPRGVFVPYTPIATNLLFFDRSDPTKEVWYFEVPGPTDRKTYSKTKPFTYDEFAECLTWWNDRKATNRAWLVPIEEVNARAYDLDIKNPSISARSHYLPAAELARQVVECAQEIGSESQRLTGIIPQPTNSSDRKPLSECLTLRKTFFTIDDDTDYQLLTVQLHARGIIPRAKRLGSKIKVKKQQSVRAGELVVAEIDAKVGGFGIVPLELDGAIVSSHYFVYELDEDVIDRRYLEWYLRSGIPEVEIQPHVKGSTNYAAIRQNHFPMLMMPFPQLAEQRRIAADLDKIQVRVDSISTMQTGIGVLLAALPLSVLGAVFSAVSSNDT